VHSSFVDVWETPLGAAREARLLRSERPLLLDRRRLFGYLTRYYDWPFHPSTLVMRREVWERTGPFEAVYALADTARGCSVSCRALPRYGVLNRRHSGNWSNRVGSARMQAEIVDIGERALLRRWPRGGPRRFAWRAVWRANARLLLLLTVCARVATGHGDAAAAAWATLTKRTGTRLLEGLDGTGQWRIRRRAARRAIGSLEDRQSVSAL